MTSSSHPFMPHLHVLQLIETFLYYGCREKKVQNNLALHPTSAQVHYLLIYPRFFFLLMNFVEKMKTLGLFIWASSIVLFFLYKNHRISEIGSFYPSGEQAVLLCWAPKQSYTEPGIRSV
jgi:hypothetical protein